MHHTARVLQPEVGEMVFFSRIQRKMKETFPFRYIQTMLQTLCNPQPGKMKCLRPLLDHLWNGNWKGIVINVQPSHFITIADFCLKYGHR